MCIHAWLIGMLYILNNLKLKTKKSETSKPHVPTNHTQKPNDKAGLCTGSHVYVHDIIKVQFSLISGHFTSAKDQSIRAEPWSPSSLSQPFHIIILFRPL